MINCWKLFLNCCWQLQPRSTRGMHGFAYSFLYRGDICGICEMAYLKVNCSRAQTFAAVGFFGRGMRRRWGSGGRRRRCSDEFEIYSNLEQTATCCNSLSDCGCVAPVVLVSGAYHLRFVERRVVCLPIFVTWRFIAAKVNWDESRNANCEMRQLWAPDSWVLDPGSWFLFPGKLVIKWHADRPPRPAHPASCSLAGEVLAAGDILIWSVSGRRPTENRKCRSTETAAQADETDLPNSDTCPAWPLTPTPVTPQAPFPIPQSPKPICAVAVTGHVVDF